MLSDGIRTISYGVNNKPTSVSKGGTVLNFRYGPDKARYKQTRQESGSTATIYYLPGYELEVEGESYTQRSYVSANIMRKTVNGQGEWMYMHLDHLGSVSSIIDSSAVVKQSRLFDPFGKPVEANSSIDLSGLLGSSLSNKGFTGHEHLDAVDLIHMNGRIYDANLGRFFSVDPFISAPSNSQAYNPYSYVMNNPLAYTDPTGYAAEDGNGGEQQPPPACDPEKEQCEGETEEDGKPEACKTHWCLLITYSDGTSEYSVSGNGSGSSPSTRPMSNVGAGGNSGDTWTDQQGNSTTGPAGFNGTETACGCLGGLWKSEQQSENDENAARALQKGIDDLAGSFASPPPPDDEETQNIRQPSKSDPKILRQNLIDRGWEPKQGDAAHHIVAGNAPRAAAARSVLKKYGIDINTADNGVFLPHNSRVSGQMYHRSIHTRIYYREVNGRLSQATSRNEAIEILRGIRSDITYGTFPH